MAAALPGRRIDVVADAHYHGPALPAPPRPSAGPRSTHGIYIRHWIDQSRKRINDEAGSVQAVS